MRTLVILSAIAGAVAIPAAAQAQQRPAILIVDTDTILTNCNACKAASTQLQSRETTLRNRAQQLRQEIETEGKPLQDALEKLGNKQPDAALQNRINAFQQKQQKANQELQASELNLRSTAAHVQQQLGNKLVQIVEQTRARRGALVALSKGSTLANDTSVDVTTEVLNALNQQLPAVSITPLPQQQQQQQPQGR